MTADVSSTKDIASGQITLEVTIDAPRQKVWDAWSDGEALAAWWGPQGWPATTESFDFEPGGHWHYKMTGPDGTEAWSWVEYLSVAPIERFTARSSFCDAAGTIDTSALSANWEVVFDDLGDSTRLTTTLRLESPADLQRLITMGFEQGYTQSLENLERYVAGLPVYGER